MKRRDGKAAMISMTQFLGPDLIGHSANASGTVEGAHLNRAEAAVFEFEGRKADQENAELVADALARPSALPEDPTGLAAYLDDAEADCIVPECFNVDGGQWMS